MNLPRATTNFLLATVLLACLASAAPLDRHLRKSPRFHDPSTPIRQGDTWVVFSTGNGISTRYSQDLKTWTEGTPVFKELPAWHREVVPNHKGYLWAPDVIRRGDRYLLYYSVSGWGEKRVRHRSRQQSHARSQGSRLSLDGRRYRHPF